MPYVHSHAFRVKGKRVSASWWEDRQAIKRGPGFLPIPRLRQRDTHCCGFLAVLAVVRVLRPEKTDREAIAAVRPNYWGLDEYKIMAGLRRLGIVPEERQGLRWNQVLKATMEGTPVIVWVYPPDWDYNHWTAIRGISPRSGRVWLGNMDEDTDYAPERSDGSISWEEFKAIWPGSYGILCHRK